MVLEGSACLEAADIYYLAGWQGDGWCCDGIFDGGTRGGGWVLGSDREDEGCCRESGRESDGNHDGREDEEEGLSWGRDGRRTTSVPANVDFGL